MKAYSYYRLSTLDQVDGDGLRRQEEDVRKYCATHGLKLDSRSMKDIGLSGYHAEHLKRGALGVFIAAIEDKKIETPCALVIEHLDRLSRQKPMKSMRLLWDIVESGVTVHTTMRERVYTAEMGMSEMMDSMIHLFTAHEESDKKAKRIQKMWAEKRANAHKTIMTRSCPAWLEAKADKSGFKVIRSKAAIVRKIFEMTANGVGKTKIVDHLTTSKVEPWNGAKRWHQSYVQKLMGNPNVLGHLRTGHWIDGKYITDEALIENYYPAIITQEQWDAAHASRAARTPQYNRYDQSVPRDLMAGLVHINGRKAAWRNKGKRWKNSNYSIYYKTFDNGREVDSIRREEIEMQLLGEIAELDPARLVVDPPNDPEENQIKELDERIAELEQGIERMVDSLASGLSSPAIVKRITESEKALEKAKTQKNRIRKDTSELSRANIIVPDTIRSINELALVDDNPEIRQAVSRQLHEIIARADYHVGFENFPKDLKKEYRTHDPSVVGLTTKEDYTAYCLSVEFINGSVIRRVSWHTLKDEFYS